MNTLYYSAEAFKKAAKSEKSGPKQGELGL